MILPSLPSACFSVLLCPCGLPTSPKGQILLVGVFHERHRQATPKPRTSQPAGYCPEGLWDKRGVLGRFPAFPRFLSLCPSAYLNVPLCPSVLPTPPCGAIFTIEGLKGETQALCFKVWGFMTCLDNPEGFWHGRGCFGRLPAFSAVTSLLPSASLNVPRVIAAGPGNPASQFLLLRVFCERHRHPAPKFGDL